MHDKQTLFRQLDQLERLAKGSRWQRLRHSPRRYLYGQYFQKLIYPRRARGRLVTARTFWGRELQLLLPAAMDIYLLGGKTHDSEIRLTRFLINRLQPGDSVADIGAHVGFFTLLAAELTGPSGRVEAFEASANTCRMLERNLENLPHATARHCAVSDAPGQLDFYEFPAFHTEYNTLRPEQFADQPWYEQYPPERHEVPAVTFDTFCRENDFRPQLIKIDVEGAEDRVVAGMPWVLSTLQPTVILEYLAEDRLNQPHRRATRRLRDHGYQAHFITAGGQLERCPDIERRLRKAGLDSDNVVFVP